MFAKKRKITLIFAAAFITIHTLITYNGFHSVIKSKLGYDCLSGDLECGKKVNGRILIPISQDWGQKQFEYNLKLVNKVYGQHNSWERCPNQHTLYFENIKTIFTGIPKVGHSNWMEALLVANGDMPRLESLAEKNQFFNSNHQLIIEKEVQNAIEKYGSRELDVRFSFTVLRNPWTRMVSGYLNKLTQDDPAEWLREERMSIVREIRGVTDKILLKDLYPTFQEFAQWIIIHHGSVDPHFKLQTLILCIPAAKYDFILPLENVVSLKEEVLTLISNAAGEYSLQASTNFLRGSYDGSQDPRTQSSALKAKQMLSELDKDTIEKLYDIYKLDFALLNYSNFTDPNFPLPLQYY